jgi:Zn-dependent peptidase ImmA (M78 family)
MDSENETLFGLRLKLARKMAGMSLQELSDALEHKVSKQALSKYEMGLMSPTSEVLSALSKALKVKPEYFLKKKSEELGQISFRKKASLSKKDEEAIIEKARDYVERHIELEFILAIETKFANPLFDFRINNKADVEAAAYKLREIWELGMSPIPNLVEMLEFRGVKVFLVHDIDDIDGFAVFTSNNIPLVVVNIKDKSLERIRFTIIHELAHLLLLLNDSIKSDHRAVEILCHCFSSCFLAPSKGIIEMIGGKFRTYITIKELINIKEYYGISIRAIIHRLKDLQIINDNYYQRWVIYLSKTYGHKKEPGSYQGQEKSKYFEQLISRALSEGLITTSKAASLCNVSTNEIRKSFASVNE